MKFPKQFIDEISQFENIYCLITGGFNSSTSAFLLKDYGFKNVILLNNKTYLEEPIPLKTMYMVSELTGYPLIRTEPNLKERPGKILAESFEQWRVEAAVEDMKNIRNTYRDKIPCCRKLKKTPGKKWFKENKLHFCRDVVISSICPYEGGALSNRWARCKELRVWNTFLRFHSKMGGVWYAYPYRDFTKKRHEQEFYYYLRDKGIMPEHSGCNICPIRVIRMVKRNEYYDCPDLRFYCKKNNLDIYDFIPKGKQESMMKWLNDK